MNVSARSSVLASILALTAVTVLPAQETGEEAEPASDEPQLERREEILVEDTLPYLPESNTITTKLPLPLAETPASVAVVTAPLLAEQNAAVLGDALENVSGLNVQTGNGVFDFYVVRGLDSVSSGMILTDGAPEPEASFYQLYNVDRVEVLKGPSSFLYGGSPLAGTVNLVRKQPLPSDFARVAVTGGSYGTGEAIVDWNSSRDDGTLAFRLNTLYRESEGYRDDKDSRVFAVNPSLTWTPDDRTRLNLSLEHVDSEYSPDAGLPLVFGRTLPEVPRQRSYQSPFDRSEQEIDRLQVDFERQIGARGTLRAKLYYRRLDWHTEGTLFNGVFPSSTGELEVSRLLSALDDEQQFLGTQLEYVLEAETGGIAHNLLFGLELSRLTDEFTFQPLLLPAIGLLDPVETASRPLFPIPGQDLAADAETVVVAPYIVDQIGLTERLRVLVGVRWDNADFEERLLPTSRDDNELSPLLGVLYEATAALSLYANYGAAFAPPSSFGIQPDRVPEESTQYELGVKADLGRRVDGSLALFQIERDNIPIPDEFGISRQVGDQRARGVELEVSAEVARRTRLLVVYAYTDGELTSFNELVQVVAFPPSFITVDRSGNIPAFTPEHLANAWLSRHYDSGLGFGFGGRYVGEQFIAEDNLFTIDDYFTFDASIFYRFDRWRLSLFLENLTGEEYLTRGFGAASVIPAAESSAYLTVEYIF